MWIIMAVVGGVALLQVAQSVCAARCEELQYKRDRNDKLADDLRKQDVRTKERENDVSEDTWSINLSRKLEEVEAVDRLKARLRREEKAQEDADFEEEQSYNEDEIPDPNDPQWGDGEGN